MSAKVISLDDFNKIIDSHSDFIDGNDGIKADFSGFSLAGLNIIGRNLNAVDFRNTYIDGSLKTSRFDSCSFAGTSIQSANAQNAIFTDCIFNKTKIEDSKFGHAVFNHCVFVNTYIRNCDFSDAVFLDCTFCNTTIKLCTCDNADFSGSLFDDKCVFIGCFLDNTKWEHTNLGYANFKMVSIAKKTYDQFKAMWLLDKKRALVSYIQRVLSIPSLTGREVYYG